MPAILGRRSPITRLSGASKPPAAPLSWSRSRELMRAKLRGTAATLAASEKLCGCRHVGHLSPPLKLLVKTRPVHYCNAGLENSFERSSMSENCTHLDTLCKGCAHTVAHEESGPRKSCKPASNMHTRPAPPSAQVRLRINEKAGKKGYIKPPERLTSRALSAHCPFMTNPCTCEAACVSWNVQRPCICCSTANTHWLL